MSDLTPQDLLRAERTAREKEREACLQVVLVEMQSIAVKIARMNQVHQRRLWRKAFAALTDVHTVMRARGKAGSDEG